MSPTKKYQNRLLIILSVAAMLVALFVSSLRIRPVGAALLLVVDTTVDETDGSCADGDCSLRDAIALAAAGDTITFDPAITTIVLSDQITLTQDIIIDGGSTAILDGNNASRHFLINSGTATLQNITLQNGNPHDATNGVQDHGGALEIGVGATVMISNSQLLSNTVAESDEGAAIYSQGDLTIYNSVIAFNSVFEENSHAVYNVGGTLVVHNSSITDNSTGGIYNFRAAVETIISNSTIANNEHKASGGGISNIGSQLAVINSTLSGNTSRSNSASFGGGGLFNSLSADYTVSPPATTAGTVIISNTTFANNTHSFSHINNWGGDVTVFNSTFSGGSGRGIVNQNPREVLDFSVLPPVTVETITSTTTLNNAIVTDSAFADCNGTISAGGDNLAEDATCDAATQSASINLAPLADNGCVTLHATLSGPACVQTMALQSGSAAIDNANSNAATATATDQRDAPTDGTGRDTGAFEDNNCFYLLTGFSVDDTASLTEAINCFNDITDSSQYTIAFTDNISLTANLPNVQNDTVGVSLLVAGEGFALDAQNSRRAIRIFADTHATFDRLTIMNGSNATGANILNSGTLTLTNSTVTGGTASNVAGGINNFGATLTLINSTVAGNSAANGGGGLRISGGSSVTLINSIVADNAGGDCDGTVGVSRNSLVSDNTCGVTVGVNGNLTNVDARLAPLTEVDGALVHALQSGSPASAGGDAASCPAIDQRGAARPQPASSVCDMGSYESDLASVIEVSKSAETDPTLAPQIINYTIVISNTGNVPILHGVVSDTLSTDTTFVANSVTISPTTAGTIASTPTLITDLYVSSGESVTITYRAIVDADVTDGQLLTNTVAVTDTYNSTPVTAQATVTVANFCTLPLGEPHPTTAGSTNELNIAIFCYNALTTSGTYTISLTNDITLTASTVQINNAIPGVALHIAGNGFKLDGNDSVRGIDIANANVTIDNLTIQNGHADSADGGGIRHVNGTLLLTNSTLTSNIANRSGGGIVVFDGTVTISNTQIISNFAYAQHQAAAGGGLSVLGGNVTVQSSDISHNVDTFARGGGVYLRGSASLTIADSRIANNRSPGAGGIFMRDWSGADPQLTLLRTTVDGNDGYAGGLRLEDGFVDIIDSTVSNNISESGGAIYNEANVTIVNSTISGNQGIDLDNNRDGRTARGGGTVVAGIRNEGTITMTHVTIVNNYATSNDDCCIDVVAGGFYNRRTATLHNVLLAGNVGEVAVDPIPPWLSELGNCHLLVAPMMGADTMADDDSCGSATQVADAMVGALADNGGSTQTHALHPDSPAIDAITTTLATTDQRATVRPSDGTGNGVALADVGAYEFAGVGPITYSVSTADVSEGDSGTTTMTFTVMRSAAINTGAVDIGFGGTATDGVDYNISVSGTLTFPIGTSTQMVTVTVVGDTDVEPDETVVATLLNVMNGVLDSSSAATGTILNDDDTSGFTSTLPVAHLEGNTGEVTVFEFEVQRSGFDSGEGLSYVVTPDMSDPAEAAEASDFVGGVFPSGDVEFGNSLTATIVISVAGDLTVEFTDQFIVTLSERSRGLTITQATAQGRIWNDDIPTGTVDDVTVDEAAGAAVLTMTLDRPLENGYTNVIYSTISNTATSPDDYELRLFETFTFGTGGITQTVAITVPIVDDALIEGSETFTVVVETSNFFGDTTQRGGNIPFDTATVTIVDNDEATVTLSGGTSVAEGDAGSDQTLTFTATLDAATAHPFAVAYATADGSALAGTDYVASSGALAFSGTAGETQTFTVTVNGDNDVEADETLTVTLGTVTGVVSSNVTTAGSPQIVTIVNDDVDLMPDTGDGDQDEGDAGTMAFTFVVTRTGDVSGVNSAEFTTTGTGSNPADAADFGGSFPSGIVNFATGQVTQTVTISVTGDATAELDETFAVNFTNPTRSIELSPSVITGTIRNDDIAGVTALPTALTITETESAPFTITLDTQPTAPVTLTLAVVDNIAGCALSTSSVVLTPANYAIGVAVVVTATLDPSFDDETCTISEVNIISDDSFYDGLTAPRAPFISVLVTVKDVMQTAVGLTEVAAMQPNHAALLWPTVTLLLGTAALLRCKRRQHT